MPAPLPTVIPARARRRRGAHGPFASKPARVAAARALPLRLRRPRLLVVGCGDVGTRLLRALSARLPDRLHAIAVTRSAASAERARALGARGVVVDLDDRRAVHRLGALARWTIHLAPPPASGTHDPRIAALIAAARISLPRRRSTGAQARWVYAGTTGVYGDTGGAHFDETRPIAPANARALRRAAAESQLRSLARSGRAQASILRVPALYAHDRWPLERLRRGDPVPHADEDVYTNHVHAEDLARIAWLALFRGRPARVVHATDDLPMRLGDWLDRVAHGLGLPAPPRASRAAIAETGGAALPRMLVESRRLANRRLRRELGYRLRWPSVDAALAEIRPGGGRKDPQAL